MSHKIAWMMVLPFLIRQYVVGKSHSTASSAHVSRRLRHQLGAFATPPPPQTSQQRTTSSQSCVSNLLQPSSTNVVRLDCSLLRLNHRKESSRLYSNSPNGGGGVAEISSVGSATVKHIKALLQKKKARTEFRETILEGPLLVMDALRDVKKRRYIKHVLVTHDLYPEFASLIPDNENIRISIGTDQVLASCSDTVTPQGVVAVASIPPSLFEQQQHQQQGDASDARKEFTAPFFLVLDGVQDPGNVGTLLRSSVAVGAAGAFLLPNCCDVWNPKAVRSAMGASFGVPLQRVESLEECLDFLRQHCGLESSRDFFAATMDTCTTNHVVDDDDTNTMVSKAHFEVNWNPPKATDKAKYSAVALCIGREGTGLSQQVRAAVAEGQVSSVHVPMEAGIESLNAAVCGSVIMFEYMRQKSLLRANER